MPRSGGKSKLWCFLTSLFGRRRRRTYNLVEAANRGIVQCHLDTEQEQSRYRDDHPQIRIRKSLFSRRRTYDIAGTENLADHQPLSLAGSYRKPVHFVKTCENSTTEDFVAALYKEELLQWPYASKNHSDPLCVPEVYDHPVLALCYGFQDQELRENRRRPIHRQRTPFFEFDLYDDSWVQSGLNQVLIGEFMEEEPRVDNIPVSLWMSMIEPALQTLMMYRLGRNKRLNITSKRQQTPMNSLHSTTVHGDSMQQDIQIGPPNQQQWALGLIAIFTMRIGELGERQLRHRDTISDMQIPDLNSKTRRRNRSRAKTTRTSAVTSLCTTD